jgi:hypothetical protein
MCCTLLFVVNWKSYYLAHKLTMACLAIGTLWALSPVRTVAFWAVRIVAWAFVGPWMKVVDVMWVHSWYDTTEELLVKIALAKGNMYNNNNERSGSVVRGENEIAATTVLLEPNLPDFKSMLDYDYFQQLARTGRMVKEADLKLRDMREHLFGPYCEYIPVTDNASRCPSVPLPSSYAEPTCCNKKPSIAAYYVPGQKLTGNMIMRLNTDEDEHVKSSGPEQ